ncbi:hypothetical protein P3X46_001493 [Hevea brasiliensis]|uniref:Uncharacterized protein n=1 Tax=Hevea brasiliensis TaxID=3981 RepID=A0ABQ9NET8_HEVBR|nr:putative disease resistance protein RGA3 [Hevea brasiliensis]KAJ9190273.1 hypothetical protein P3X46_001493 [Hevea brasiliensis]
MAFAVISMILERLSSFALSGLEQEARLVMDVEREIQKLKYNLESIQVVLDDADVRQRKEASVKLWLHRLKDISYDIDDVLDEWSTAIYKSQIEPSPEAPEPKRKVCSSIPFARFLRREVVPRHDIACKIKELNERLDAIAKEKDRYNFSFRKSTEQLERQITASVIDVAEVKGRENDKNEIINKLLTEVRQTPNPHIISLVGMGGIGKTTLAKLVYNDSKVAAHFNKRIWVCVSDPFDEVRIAKAILESLRDTETNSVELQTLLQQMQQSIKGQRFLLVLDDVWTEDARKWENLMHSFKCGERGSRILITTRKENVATRIGCTDILPIGQLSMEECWSVFSQIAFFGKTSIECERVEDIGRKIVKKCKGLPLAAKTLGGLLRFRKFREEWQSVLDSDVWELEEAEKDLLGALWLSYYDLPMALRQCFSYCAIFPKDHLISKPRLIKLWMAQGYLKATKRKDMEMVGEEYFQNLVVRSFFQDFDKCDDEILACKMHDIVHDFAQFLTQNECFSMEVNGFLVPSMYFSGKEPRHSMVVLAENAVLPGSLGSLKKLRTLLIESHGQSEIRAAPPDLLNQLTCLRSLDLSNCGIGEIPPEIGKLIHLRFLDLSANELVELPETVCELYNLQSLDVHWNLLTLPPGIGKLINLRHFYHDGGNGVLPKGLGKLISLREIKELTVGHNDEEAFSFGDLKDLNNLRGSLWIKGLGHVADVGEAKQAQLKKKKHVTLMRLDFFEDKEGTRGIHDQQLMEGLEPSSNLEDLIIVKYQGTTMVPSWMMSLTNLRYLSMSFCRNCEHLPPLGKLPALESLYFHVMGVKKFGAEFLGMGTQIDKDISSSSSSVVLFPRLVELKFIQMPKWEEWEEWDNRMISRDEDTIMPRLHRLEVVNCSKLKKLPDKLLQKTTLQELIIDHCEILSPHYRRGTGKYWHNISHIPNIKIDWKIMQGEDIY